MVESSARIIQPRAQKALSASPVFALRDLRVDEREERLMISGLVSSFYHKQLAQEVVRAVAEGIEVVNTITVRDKAPLVG